MFVREKRIGPYTYVYLVETVVSVWYQPLRRAQGGFVCSRIRRIGVGSVSNQNFRAFGS